MNPSPVDGAGLAETELSESGALACSVVELAIGDLDRGAMADFDAALQTAAGYASTAPELELSRLAPTLTGAASSTQPIDAVGVFLTACALHGYEL